MPNTRGPDTSTAIICVNNDHNYSPSIDPFGEGFQCIDRGDPRTTKHCSSCGTCVCRGCKFQSGGMVPEWSLQSLTFLDERLQPSPIMPKDERRFRCFRTIFQKNPRKHFHVNPASGMRKAGLAPEDIVEIKHLGWCKTIKQYIQEVHRRKNYQQLLSGPLTANLHRCAAEPEKFEVLRFKSLCSVCDRDELRQYRKAMSHGKLCRCELVEWLCGRQWLCRGCGNAKLHSLEDMAVRVYGDFGQQDSGEAMVKFYQALDLTCGGVSHQRTIVCTWFRSAVMGQRGNVSFNTFSRVVDTAVSDEVPRRCQVDPVIWQ